MTDTIEFTQNTYEAFKKAYSKAIENKLTSFIFEQHEFLVTYAKYLIEYYESTYE